MIPIRFHDLDSQKRALDCLAGRFPVKKSSRPELHVPAAALADLAIAGLDFQVMGSAATQDSLGGPIINGEAPSAAPGSSCLVRTCPGQDGHVVAQLLGAPDIQATAATPEEAIEQVRTLLEQEVNLGSIASIEVPQQNPLVKWAGYLKDDPDFDDYVEEIRKFREEMDRREGYVPETDECSDTSSTPTT